MNNQVTGAFTLAVGDSDQDGFYVNAGGELTIEGTCRGSVIVHPGGVCIIKGTVHAAVLVEPGGQCEVHAGADVSGPVVGEVYGLDGDDRAKAGPSAVRYEDYPDRVSAQYAAVLPLIRNEGAATSALTALQPSLEEFQILNDRFATTRHRESSQAIISMTKRRLGYEP